MTLRSSPTTSEIASVRHGAAAAAASRPPLTADRCLRTVFSAWMSAPARSSTSVVAACRRASCRRRAPPSAPMRRPTAARAASRRVGIASRQLAARAGRPRSLPGAGTGWLADDRLEAAHGGAGASVPIDQTRRERGRRDARRGRAPSPRAALPDGDHAHDAAVRQPRRRAPARASTSAPASTARDRRRGRSPADRVGELARERVSACVSDRTRRKGR